MFAVMLDAALECCSFHLWRIRARGLFRRPGAHVGFAVRLGIAGCSAATASASPVDSTPANRLVNIFDGDVCDYASSGSSLKGHP